MAGLTIGRALLSLQALSTSVSCYIADWNETHVKNPKWPPHARFHNGQTMSMGLCLGALTAYYTWRPTPDLAAEKDSITSAAVIGTKWTDPEFGTGAPQRPVFLIHAIVAWLGWWFEMRRLSLI
ncbi:hypothetical protein LTS07_001186 [Exophiala sideris]|uniref:Uncharacterized protein n=1 Tax=Exophiala sideris TaxID=1016849 RepID=A0ABR0JN90_9EURO|nr:hypothetical protein LTS07_001186 [Exophiala sideris]KAK5043701.1 hypothetical protein LTR13_000055 [Exophiala sideris]KAK5067200.1 hypothetical protein LTR69_001187 [Exophiala sideris]KAK5182533.1 hypothetical protein LTR44_004924 [Eurotiomycetes sp. CCFEE 6388]